MIKLLILILFSFSINTLSFSQYEDLADGKPVKCGQDDESYQTWCGNNYIEYIIGVETWKKYHGFGEIKGDSISSTISNRKGKYLIFGPYFNTDQPGSLFVTIKLEVTHFERLYGYGYKPNESLVYIDLTSNRGKKTLASKRIFAKELPLNMTLRHFKEEKSNHMLPGLFGRRIRISHRTKKWAYKEYRLKKKKYFEVHFNVPVDKPTDDIEVRIREVATHMNILWLGTQVTYTF